MVLTTLVALLPHCAPAVDQSTALRLIAAESGGRQFAININGNFRLSRQPANYDEFRDVVLALDASGYNFDFGFTQANNREIRRRGFGVDQFVDPCSNLQFMEKVLVDCFNGTSPKQDSQSRIAYTLSCYNTGRYGPGFTNGYVSRVWKSTTTKAGSARAYIPYEKIPHQLKENPL
ncbi:transglycosylase SLT domain-containing protein [Curvibacter sp. APW13]|uniref:transglycosylase SLT domain-containing protein n=1 Tax=Curvibacter sp. APW13 TaxID=3077236 RepID=UPI0028E091A7|nr:transglycosylase SLT domain-containing protein [Curvibacter sp. APW13]MDT8992865.1 transglycosylase SLT domain-containing protein [Curvibacter sp. APW13]